MRGQLIVAVATSMLAATALAQTGAPSSSTAAPAPATTTAAPTPANAQPQATSTTTVEATKVERKIKGELVSSSYLPKADLKNAENSVYTENLVGVKYSLGAGQSIALRQGFTYTFPKAGKEGSDAEGVGSFTDMYLNYVNANILEFANKGSVYFNGRLYMPTGESSRSFTKHHGVVRGHVVAAHPFGKFDIDSQLLVQYYNQTQNWYTNAKGKPAANRDSLIIFYPIEVAYNIKDNLQVAVDTQLVNYFYRPNPTGLTREHNFVLEAYMYYKPISQLGINVGAYNQINIYNQGAYENSLFRDDEITYFVELAASI